MSQIGGPTEKREYPANKGQQGPARAQEQDPLRLETDTVELEYGAEFSETTLDILRGYERPSYLQELEDSLDPVDDLDDHLAHGIKIPPATYEALQAAGREEIEGLARMRDAPIDPEKQEEVRYRQQLAEGTQPKDLTWLKMRAYYRGAERIRAERDARNAQAEAERLAAYGVPTDKVPPEALNLTATQAAQRHKLQLAVAAANARRARGSQDKDLLSDDSLELSSSESEWPQQQQQQQQQPLSPELRAALSAQLAAYAAQRSQGMPVTPSAPDHGVGTLTQQQQQQQQQESDRQQEATDRRLRTVYTEAYLQQQQLSRRVQQQQQQRTLAFWVSLATVSGTYLVRMLRRRAGKGGGKAKGAQQQSKAQKSGKAAV
eukprot:CAMPEP_0202393840 /NCGR_PEP_ID=MMETSP1127-20130417/93119_1 /ASSEMBLY_ACC=CAM_ASM_000462 /TAXON_ID=3047 /ORGANISM="Dunaliella tertiolecta, Strain CCMP1320" /LENGTH=375 /DNA_ID=CAMNT_0048996435 /DNA_START=14 /DNA_END=1141 /DNA_ORIENTATION=-